MAFSDLIGMNKLKKKLLDTNVLGVTILTSFSDEDLLRIFGVALRVPETVIRLACLAQAAELDGVICSPAEARLIREEVDDEFLIYTPNVRFANTVVLRDDQNPKRAMSPGEAIAAGANGIVMGRPIIGASDRLRCSPPSVCRNRRSQLRTYIILIRDLGPTSYSGAFSF